MDLVIGLDRFLRFVHDGGCSLAPRSSSYKQSVSPGCSAFAGLPLLHGRCLRTSLGRLVKLERRRLLRLVLVSAVIVV